MAAVHATTRAATARFTRLISGPEPAPDLPEPGRVLLLIRSLNRGGSERQLATLARALHSDGVGVEVAVFYPGGAFESELRAAGIPVHHLGKRSRWDVFGFFRNLAALLRAARPDVLYSFLPEANLAALVARAASPDTAIVWGVRSSFTDWEQFDGFGRVLFRAGCALSRTADLVIYNSEAGLRYHAAQGFARGNAVVIPNGIDTNMFSASRESRDRIRAEWGILPEHRVIGYAGRIDPMKDHETFLRAAALAARERPDARFLIVGGGAGPQVDKVKRLANELSLGASVIWAGEQGDVAAAYQAMDVATLTSIGEGFPNTVAEAMAAALPCVVTDVGDARVMIGDTGICVPPRDPAAVCGAWLSLLSLDPKELRARGAAARERVVTMYSVDSMTQRTTDALREARRRRAKSGRGIAP